MIGELTQFTRFAEYTNSIYFSSVTITSHRENSSSFFVLFFFSNLLRSTPLSSRKVFDLLQGGYSDCHIVIEWFWEVIETMTNQERFDLLLVRENNLQRLFDLFPSSPLSSLSPAVLQFLSKDSQRYVEMMRSVNSVSRSGEMPRHYLGTVNLQKAVWKIFSELTPASIDFNFLLITPNRIWNRNYNKRFWMEWVIRLNKSNKAIQSIRLQRLKFYVFSVTWPSITILLWEEGRCHRITVFMLFLLFFLQKMLLFLSVRPHYWFFHWSLF